MHVSKCCLLFLVTTCCFILGICSASDGDEHRIIFAVDTSASLQLQQANTKIRQAILIWIKHFAPLDAYLGIVQLKQDKDDVKLKQMNDDSFLEISQILPQTAYGSPCLHCGLQYASQLFDTPTDKDMVVLLMEELSVASPYDTPQYSLDQLQPQFKIFTIALTENAASDLELLSESTQGNSDYIKDVSVAQLLLSFSSLLPISKDYVIITARDCSQEECQVKFELEDKTEEAILQLIVCSTTQMPDFKLTNGEEINFDWDAETQCWLSEIENPQAGDWSLSGMEGTSASVFVAMRNVSSEYPNLECSTSGDGTSQDIVVSAELDPKLSSYDYKVTARVETEDGSEQSLDLLNTDVDTQTFSACMKPSNKTGRHTVTCHVINTQHDTPYLTSRAAAFKVSEWSTVWPLNESLCSLNHIETRKAEITTPKRTSATSTTPKLSTMHVSTISPKVTTTIQKLTTMSAKPSTEASIIQRNRNIIVESDNKTVDNSTLIEKIQKTAFSARVDAAQITIVVVGAIVILELLCIVYKCRSKPSVDKQKENNQHLIPYSVNYKDDFDLRLSSIQYKDDEGL